MRTKEEEELIVRLGRLLGAILVEFLMAGMVMWIWNAVLVDKLSILSLTYWESLLFTYLLRRFFMLGKDNVQ